jgi:hypothetical protein
MGHTGRIVALLKACHDGLRRRSHGLGICVLEEKEKGAASSRNEKNCKV